MGTGMGLGTGMELTPVSAVPAGISCGASWCSHPPWTSARSPTTGPCSSTCCSSASTPSPPAAPTPSAPCRRAPATSATSATMEPSASTAWVSRCREGPAQGWGRRQGWGRGQGEGWGQGEGATGPMTPHFSCRLCVRLRCLRNARPVGQQRFAPLLCPRGCFELLCLHRPLLLLPVCFWGESSSAAAGCKLGLEVSSFSALGSRRVSRGGSLLRQWVWPKARGSVPPPPNPPIPFPLHSFPELERPRLSKVLRTAAFVYPFLYDNIPLFYRVSRAVRGQVPPPGGPQGCLSPSSPLLTRHPTAPLLPLE